MTEPYESAGEEILRLSEELSHAQHDLHVARVEIERLRGVAATLDLHTAHAFDCDRMTWHFDGKPEPCSCGLAEARAALEESDA